MLEVPVQACRKDCEVNPAIPIPRCDEEPTARWVKQSWPCFQEKPLNDEGHRTVPETDTGGQVENTKALERTRVKELGKLTP